MMFSWLTTSWLFITLGIVAGFVAVSRLADEGSIIHRLYLFGKLRKAPAPGPVTSGIDVPKRYFSHFYLFGICFNSLCLLPVVCSILLGPASPLFSTLQFLGCSSENGPVDSFLTLLLLMCQELILCRRYIECKWISVYSDGNISIAHYIIGIIFYLSVTVAAVVESSLVCEQHTGEVPSSIEPHQVLALIIFSWASWKQYITTKILAQLRKNSHGAVKDRQHHLPRGDLFEYASCPHYFAEILIYLAENMLTGFRNIPLLAISLFVMVNQLIAGYLTHQWYKKTFPAYPCQRKAVVPFVF